MDYVLSQKNCRLSNSARRYLEAHVEKFGRFLEKIVGEVPKLEFIIRKQRKRSAPKTPSPIYYELSVRIVLPKKPLFVHSQKKTIEEAIDVCFHRLLKELEKYKGKHISSYSKYLDHRSIRRMEKIFPKKRKR